MKKITKITAILLVSILMVATLAGCGKDRLLYKRAKLENYVELPQYKGIEIDTNSKEFLGYYNTVFTSDIEQNNLYQKEEEGAVEDGYIANIDYVGKIDGVAFDGGSSKGYNLLIGSGSFIDDFEEELIGVKVGETKDVTAKFPENYPNSPDLAGKEAVFTVTVNYISRPMTVEEAYQKMNFNSAQKYDENITSRAVEGYLFEYVCKNAKIKDYPADDRELARNALLSELATQNGISVEQFEALLEYNNKTEQFEKEIFVNFINQNIVMYCIFDMENLELLDSTLNKQTASEPIIAESYAVQETVIAFLYENAVIK